MSLAENIKHFREKREKTQRELADEVQVTPAYIALLETGDRVNPSTNVLSRIAKALDVQVNDLLNNISLKNDTN